MANTFTMVGPSGAFPGQAQPQLPQYANLSAQSQPTPGVPNAPDVFTPIMPLPGIFGVGSYAI